MEQKRYWFPVRPARDGWGWGLPLVWQGWAAYLAFFVLLIGALTLAAPYGIVAAISAGCAVAALFFGVVWCKGEPQSLRDKRPH